MQDRNRPSQKIEIVRDDSERGKVSILIVEDSPTQAERLRHILEQNGTEVRVAGNGKEALVEIRRERPRIVITDVVMPKMNGYELCGQIKRDPNLKDIPVILVTSLSDPKDVLNGLECGANSFIVKPYDEEYLLSRIRYVLANEELRKTESFKMGIEIYFAGQKYFITSDRVQILDLLLSTYESAILRNSELAQVQEELRKLNEDLDLKVQERTASLAAEITERKQAQALQSAFYRIAETTSLAEDMQEFYATIHGIVGKLMYAKNFYIALLDDPPETISFPYFVDEVDSCADPIRAETGLSGYVLRTGQPLLVTQKIFDEMVERKEVELVGPPSPYWLGVPLKMGEATFGVLVVQSYSEDIRFGEREKEILTFVSQHIAAAIERKRQEAIKVELEKQLRQSQKIEAVGMLAGGVAHDFNNTLMAINGYSELLLLQMAENDPFRSSVLEIQKAAEQGVKLTRQLLAFSRKQVLSPKILNLNDSIAQIENMLQRLVGEDVELLTAFSGELDHIKADPGQMEQVIINLAVNARDAMPKGGKLTIETENVELDETYVSTHAEVQPGRYVMLAITDAGCGMDEATLSRIFEPFFTTKEEGKGTGLGLSTVYGIVKQSGGHIWVYSQVGNGTTFKIYFPRVDEKLDVVAPVSSVDVAGHGELILLVDDNESIRRALGTFLEIKGYRVLQAAGGREALEIAHKERGEVHILISDMVMPEMSGWELIDRIASEHPKIKTLLMSGYPDEAMKRHRTVSSDTAFLQKPASMMELLLKIRQLLEE